MGKDVPCRKDVLSICTEVALSSGCAWNRFPIVAAFPGGWEQSFPLSSRLCSFRPCLKPLHFETSVLPSLCLPGFVTESSSPQRSLKLTTCLDGPHDFSHQRLRSSDSDHSPSCSQLPVDKITRNTSSFLCFLLPSP